MAIKSVWIFICINLLATSCFSDIFCKAIKVERKELCELSFSFCRIACNSKRILKKMLIVALLISNP